ncbi:MAG: twin-arginine translocase TatA/TatE family subunit [Deltaproteobacteria bacterium]|nr:twin-arginine translocase TatA/TatE family subunit [Deltaproteobacteria bacterium]
MFGLGTSELIIIGVIIFVLFGAKRLPEIGKGLGGAIREFRNVKKEISREKPSAREDKEKDQQENDPPLLEEKLAEKVKEQIPGVKEVVNVKRKVEKVKKYLK